MNSIDKKILEELKRFNQINSYIITEQEATPPPPPAEDEVTTPPPPVDTALPPAPADAAAPAATEVPEPIDVAADPDVEEVDAEGETMDDEGAEELDVTDLVDTQNDIKEKQDEFMDGIFSKLGELETKLQHMDQIMDKINSLETKFDKYREKTPEEKLMLRSLDSYPYNQKLTDFFDDKKSEMEETGKNEYVLTSDEVENFSPGEVKKTFNQYDIEDDENDFVKL